MTQQTHLTSTDRATGARGGLSTLRRLIRQAEGTAAVEFSLILPILVTLWIGGVEVTQALSVDRHLNNLATAIGDLSSRSKTLQYATVDDIFDIAAGAMYPYSTNGLQLRVTAINIDDANNATVAWSRGQGMTAYVDNQLMNSVVPSALRQFPDSQVVFAEVAYVYEPAVGYVITGNINLSDEAFFVPRLTDHVELCDNAGENCKS